MSIDEGVFRQAMSYFASGVTVVTTSFEGQLYGLTVSAFSSLSLNPQLLLICIDHRTPSHAALSSAGMFGLNILAEDQQWLSQRFATRMVDKYGGVPYQLGPQGMPLLDGALVSLECTIVGTLDGGDHTIFLGQAQHAIIRDGTPLLYYRSAYRKLTDLES